MSENHQVPTGPDFVAKLGRYPVMTKPEALEKCFSCDVEMDHLSRDLNSDRKGIFETSCILVHRKKTERKGERRMGSGDTSEGKSSVGWSVR